MINHNRTALDCSRLDFWLGGLRPCGHTLVTHGQLPKSQFIIKGAWQENIFSCIHCVLHHFLLCGSLRRLKRKRNIYNMPYSHEQLWLAVVVSVIMTFTAATGRPIYADAQYSPAASLTPASLHFFFSLPLLLSHCFSSLTTTHFPTHLLLSCVSWLLSFCHPSHGLGLRCSPKAFYWENREAENK